MSKIFGILPLLALPLLAGCESSMRLPPFGSPFGSSATQASPPPVQAAPAPQVQAAPLAPPVSQQALPPPPGTQTAETLQGGQQPAFGEPPRQATLEPPKTATAPKDEGPPPAPTRTGVTGNWSVTEASGGACRITLSSAPKLDLYGAGTSGCQSREMQRVTAWELRGDEVYLYESGGAVAARLRASGARRFDGALAKTGAPVSLAK